jgi:hypothetical protein
MSKRFAATGASYSTRLDKSHKMNNLILIDVWNPMCNTRDVGFSLCWNGATLGAHSVPLPSGSVTFVQPNWRIYLKRTLLVPLLLMAAVFVLAPGANADIISIGLQQAGINGGAIATVVSTNAGYASFASNYGSFTFNSISGIGYPNLAEPSLSSTSLNVSSGIGGAINVFVTQSGVTSPAGVNSFLSSFTSQMFSGLITSVTEQTFIDTSNGLYGGTLLASSNFTGIGSNSSVNNTPSLSNPYSETVEYTIIATGAGNVNDTVNISDPPSIPAPEPSSLLLSALGVAGLLLAKRRILSA